MSRTAKVTRTTKETDILVTIELDGAGLANADTGMPFFDHMLDAFGRHALLDLTVQTEGDTHIDAHHTVEDTAIVLGQALREALGDKAGVRRFASIVVPLDESAVEVSLDLSGRTFVVYEVPVPYETINGFDTGLLEDFIRAFAQSAELTLHAHLRYGRSPHHICEATFKALGMALHQATRPAATLQSTKGKVSWKR